jgi:uncharacterized cupredoxin-like copper-binding protein
MLRQTTPPKELIMNFALQHAATLLKYGGISFIAGAVNHGFFSETRSLWTAAIGVLIYLLGSALEMRAFDQSKTTWRQVFGWGIVFSVGIGFFTGGLQHFPDSPSRSLWVVPLGFALSLVSLLAMEGQAIAKTKSLLLYALCSLAVVCAGSYLAYSTFQNGSGGHAHDGPGHSHSHETPNSKKNATALKLTREINIEMNDQMRFVPNHVSAKQGEVIQFNVINTGKIRHEFLVGTAEDLKAHAAEMKKMAAGHVHQHDDGHSLSLAAGERGHLIIQFNEAKDLQIACYEPGHFEAGMHGHIHVTR